MTAMRGRKSGWLMLSVKPTDWVLLGFMVLAVGGLWTTSAKLLVTSGWRDNGRVLGCIYFTGTGVIERQYPKTLETDQPACPVIELG
ncbi:MAG: hypothetical protein AVDCRST_MAG04-1444 [uncultured Acetobacteraceae bacterium]|uniref:Uncharacterized protein n=1 Tax=uncultured Acetobacteraceae bacterium TaxID=169975 RepID=A0A6J4I155_9PROT|nr:MAG: hypothetical protein AVDCRST_MAG04-1444 [uncultured Acetobacteraceae bacterium]